MLRGILVLAIAACSSPTSSSPDAAVPPAHVAYDVVVVGAGTSGTAAAIAGARHGAHVLLVEPTYWIGGQMATVTALEDAVALAPGVFTSPVRTGFVAEVIPKLDAHYAALVPPQTISYIHGRYFAEPNVIRDVLTAELQSARVDVRLRTSVTAIARDGATVTGATLSDGTLVDSKIVIDATETGDVLPLAGVAYRSGNQDSRGTIDLAACTQSITYVVPIRKYPAGPPSELVMTAPPPGYDQSMHDLFAAKLVDLPNPDPTMYPWGWAHHNAYRQVPDSAGMPYSFDAGAEIEASITRTSMNLVNDYPTTGDLAIDYLEVPDARRMHDCNARLLSLQLLYYAQHDLGETSWSVADDEGFDTDFDCPNIPDAFLPIARKLPPFPYIRESRRIVAEHVLTGHEIERDDPSYYTATPFHTAIARGWYVMDLHRCAQSADQFEADTGDGVFPPQAYGPLQIPFESLIPIDVDGFLAAEKNIGVSRLANGSTRLEAVTMLVGQAAGTVAALAVMHGAQPRTLDPYEVQRALVADGDGLSMNEYFDDVAPASPAWGAIQLAVTRGLLADATPPTGGANAQFAPAGSLLRNDAARAIATLYKLPLGSGPSDIPDVPSGDPYLRYIQAIVQAGITAGCGGGNYCPTQPLQRAQLAVFVVKGMGMTTPPPCATPPFSDVPTTDPTCRFVAYAAAQGLMTGCGGTTFCPTTAVTRADAALALVATMNEVGAPL